MANLDLAPVLVGPNITVRPIENSDWQGLFAAAADPKLWAQHPSSDRYQEPVFKAFFDAAIASKSAFTFVDNKSGQLMGSSRYNGFDKEASEIEIGWTFIARSHWGGTANAEIKTLMLNHAFGFVETVVFWVGETNQRSRRAMQKIGGVLRDGVHYREIAGDEPHVIFEIHRADWQRRS